MDGLEGCHRLQFQNNSPYNQDILDDLCRYLFHSLFLCVLCAFAVTSYTVFVSSTFS